MFGIGHIDEIDYDYSAYIAQTQLPSYLLDGFEVGAVHGIFTVVRTYEL